MKKLRFILIAAGALLVSQSLLTSSATAQERPARGGEIKTVEQFEAAQEAGQTFQFDNAVPFYRAGEFSIDLFGTAQTPGGVANIEEAIDEHQAGVGIGLNYFYTRNLGVSYELRGQARNLRHDFLNESSLSLVYRIPIGTIAPYVFAGGGYEIINRKIDFNAHAGAGLEVRLSPHVGVFSDVRVITENFRSASGYLGRAGVRLSF